MDAALPNSVHRLAMLRWLLTALLGVVLIGVPIIMQDLPEPQPAPFILIVLLYVFWALVQNKLVRIYAGMSLRPAQVCRVWARSPYGELWAETPRFEVFLLRRPRERGGDPVVLMLREQETTDAAAPLRSVSSCCCCYTDFESDHEVAVLVCGHIFCESCIVTWALSGRQSASTCPVCRYVFECEPGVELPENPEEEET
ncbi:Rnf222 [Symbiodinium sp. KB8]|nr:Rnf222 [Symbiodinium sp. KB8]